MPKTQSVWSQTMIVVESRKCLTPAAKMSNKSCCGGFWLRFVLFIGWCWWETDFLVSGFGLSQQRSIVSSHSGRPSCQPVSFLNTLQQITIKSSADANDILSSNDKEDDDWREDLPSPLQQYKNRYFQRMETIVGETPVNIYVLGTNHLLEDSAQHVKLLCETVQPDLIFVELCPSRASVLDNNKRMSIEDVLEMQENTTDMSSFVRNIGWKSWIQAYFLNISIGGEWQAAYRYWEERSSLDKPLLVLGDRPIQITSARYDGAALTKLERFRVNVVPKIKLWGGMIGTGWLWNRLRKVRPIGGLALIFAIVTTVLVVSRTTIYRDIFVKRSRSRLFKGRGRGKARDQEQDNVSFVPALNEVLLHERDRYMACKLFQGLAHLPKYELVGEHFPILTNKSVYNAVVVVGAAHVAGICAFFPNLSQTKNAETCLEPLLVSNADFTEDEQAMHMTDTIMVTSDQSKLLSLPP